MVRHLETSFHISVVSFLKLAVSPEDAIFFHPANGEVRDIRTAAKLKAMGLLAGVPDLVFILPNGLCAFLELKAPGGKLSQTQKAFRTKAEAMGCKYAVAYKMEDVVTALEYFGIPSRAKIGG